MRWFKHQMFRFICIVWKWELSVPVLEVFERFFDGPRGLSNNEKENGNYYTIIRCVYIYRVI